MGKTMLAKIKRTLKELSPTQLMRTRLSNRYLHGDGIEIGALHSPLRVSQRAQVRYVDRLARAQLLIQYPELANTGVVDPDIIEDGERLTSIADSSLDFIIANHFIEHCENPIRTLQNFFLKLKDTGVIYMAVPDKRYNFDQQRASTTFEHLRSDHADDGKAARASHYVDFARYAHFRDAASAEEVGALAEQWLSTHYSIHFHVWTFDEFQQFLSAVKSGYVDQLRVVEAKRNGHEGIFILGKEPSGEGGH